MEPMVTVIVPVYNGEKVIERCLTSIRNQTFKNMEVLVVDDGSTDHTERVLSKVEAADSRFRILDKSNSGVSDSRNLAIAQSRGKYIQFVDSDDWLVRTATQQLVKAAEDHQSDMVITDFYRVIGHMITHKGHIPREGVISRKEYAEFMMKAPANFYYGVLWNKFFRADIIKENGLFCSTKLDWCEDFQFNLEFLQYARSIYVLQNPLYYYVKTKGSLVDTKVNLRTSIKTKQILFEYYKELYQALDLYDKNRLRLQAFFIEFARDKKKKDSVEKLA